MLIFDTTLRDGEQSPGATMSIQEKRDIATLLDEMGVDIIEAGFPAASEGDFASVRAIAETVKEASVCGLARAAIRDIDCAWRAVGNAHRPRIHTFIATSPLHMEHKLRLTPDAVLAHIEASVTHARNLCPDVQWSPEDATRSEPDFLCRAVETAIRAGAGTINIPDTVGYAVPRESAETIRMLRARVPDTDKVTFSTHCHDDLGMAVANSLAAAEGGARQVECTINGLGERAGNAALEEVVMAIRVRNDQMPFHTGIDTTMLMRASRMVSAATGFPVQYNKAIVGRNAFAHESGIHQDGMLKHSATYEIMRPEHVGLAETALILGKHSGRHAFREKLRALGYALGETMLADAFQRFKALADQKKTLYDADLIALVDDTVGGADGAIKLYGLRVVCGTQRPARAEITLEIRGETRHAEGTGDGPVDATFNAIKALVPHAGTLKLYQVGAVTQGTDAQAEVSVRLESADHVAVGQAADTDTVTASARAYLHAIERLAMRRKKSARAAPSRSREAPGG